MAQEEEKIVKEAVYTEEEIKDRSKKIKQLERSKNDRDGNHKEFDDMDYNTHYNSNAEAAYSYIPEKRNPEDTRIVTGTTKQKGKTLLSALLNYNLEPNIEAYDENNNLVNYLGENVEALVKKSREIERYDNKRRKIYKEYLDQGTVFVEEYWCEDYEIEKKVGYDWRTKGVDPKKMKIEEKTVKGKGYAKTRLLPGTGVYLGNITESDIDEQPFIFTVEPPMPYDKAKQIYGEWARWENVNPKIVKTVTETTTEYTDWTLFNTGENMVEVIKYQDKPNNEYQIFLNGTMMLPVGFPLTEISPSGKYTIAKGDNDLINAFFAYGKSIPSDMKVDQEVLDEFYRLIILKIQQSFKWPMANNTNQVLSSKIFMPGHITNNINPAQLQPIITPTGVTPSEFSAFQLIKSIVDEKTVSPVFSGDVSGKDTTATEVIEMKKQQMMKLGLTIYGIIQLEIQLAWLKIHTILANWTKEIDERVDPINQELVKIYPSYDIKSNLENGEEGIKRIEFNPVLAEQMSPEAIMAQEDYIKEQTGQNIRITYLNPEFHKKMKLIWYITITPTEKDTSELRRVLFSRSLAEGFGLFGIQSFNLDYAKQRWAIMNKEDPDKLFAKQPMMPQMAQGGQMQGQGQLEAQMMPKQPATPSINTLQNA